MNLYGLYSLWAIIEFLTIFFLSTQQQVERSKFSSHRILFNLTSMSFSRTLPLNKYKDKRLYLGEQDKIFAPMRFLGYNIFIHDKGK